MASGVSGRQSVSPSNGDEVYQSPGASQEDTVDHLLAHYGGIADRRPGEGGGVDIIDGGVAGGENNTAHRNRSAVVLERPAVGVSSPSGAHPPRHFLTPSPRHAVSAPTSHQTTPAREEDPVRKGRSGHPGDTRSFSWDNVASGASSGTQGSGVNYPTTAAEIIELLQKKICFLSGGRAREGQSLITFPAKDKNFEYDRDELRRVIQYLASIPMEDVREYGFSVIVDARHSSWHSTKLVLHSLQEVLPGLVHVAYIIQPSHFWQKQATTRGHNKEKKKNRLEFSTIMLSEVDKLKRHIDPSQVTFDLGGYLPYSHDDWIKLRYDLERFIASFNALMEHTSHVEQQLHMQGEEGEGADVETAEDALTRHIQIHDQLRKAPQSTIREGNELLRRLEQGRDEGGTSAMTPDKINAVTVIRRLLESVNRRQTQMDDVWRERRAVLEQTLELRVFEKALQKVRGWLKARGEETLSSRNDIGDDLDSTQLIQEQHNKFEAKAKSMYNNLTQLRRMADRFAGKNHFASDTLQRQVAKLSTKFSRFENHLGERRMIVVGSLRFHTSYKEWHTQSDHTVAILKEGVSAPDQTSAEQLLTEHRELVSQLEELGLAVEKEGQELLEVMETVTRRSLENRASGQPSRPGPDYSGGIRYVESTLGEMRKKKHRVVQLAEARKLTLQQCRQLHSCESDARQVTKWLSDISDKLASSHGDIGTSKQTVEKLLNDHDKQTENAKKTYKYGCDLVSAAQRSRRASRLEDSDNTDLLSALATQWEGLSAALVEARARLEVAQQFHHLADEVMECYSRWTTPIHQLAKTPPTVKAHLTDLSTHKEGFAQKITECLKIGTSLLDRMCRPLTSNPAYRNLNEPAKQSLAFLRSRLQEIERQTVDLEAVLSCQESVLKEFLVYCQFEHNMEQVLVWMQDEGLKSMQRFTVVGETHSTVQSQLTLFQSFSSACQERGEEVRRLVTSAPRLEAEITGFKSELTKKTQSLSAVWDKFASRLAERERALRLAASFYDRVTKLQSLTGELESHLSTEVTSLQSPLRPYLENLSSRHSEMTTLFRLVSDDGVALVEMFKPTGESAGDSGRSARISAQISNLQTHCQRVEQLWSDAWGREGGAGAGKTTTSGRKTTGGGRTSNQPTKRESVTGRASGQVKTDVPSGARGRSQSKTSKSSSLPSQVKPSQTSQANTKPGPTTKSSQTSSAKASDTTSQTSTAKAGATSSQTSTTAKSQVGKTHQTNTSVTVSRGSGDVGKNKPTRRVGKAVQRPSSPTYTQPPPPPPPTSTPTTSAARSGGTSSKNSEPRKRDSLKARDKGASPTAVGPGNSSGKRLSDTYGDLEAEAYKHLERLESECSRFHSSHCEMGDEVKRVSELREQYLKFLDIIRPTCSSIDQVISSLQGLQSAHSPPPSPSLITGVTQLCEGLRKRVGWWRGGFATLADTLNLFLSFSELSSKVTSDLQALEDSFCETIDLSISMESAQKMLDHYQPLAAGLRQNYPTMKQLGEQFLETTSKMTSEKSAPELSVGGACISVAVEMGGVEGRYPEALEVWSRRERQLQQSLEWQSFQQNIQQLSSWMKTASESFLVRFDLGTSLVTTEDLEMEFQEFKARAQVTTKEVELALAQSEKMLGETHFAAASLRELSWNLRELLEDFTARTREREKTLHEAADFFSAAEELQNDMKDVITRCKDSPSIVTIRKETSLPSVSFRLVNLQTAGTNLVSLGEGNKKGSVRGRKRKLIRSDSSGATEFSLKQTLSGLQSLYAEYKTALEGRKVTTGASLTRQGTEKKEKTTAGKREGETEREPKEHSPAVVLRRKERSDHRLQSGDIPIELKRKSWSFQRREGVQLTSRWENRDSNKKSTVESRSTARQAVKSEKLNRGGSSEEGSSFKRSYTLPGHFRGWRAPGLSVLEKAAAFSKVTEGTGLSAPYGLKASTTSVKKTRRPSLDSKELDTKKCESQPKTATSDKVAGSSSREKSVGKPPATSAVQTAVVKTVISQQESVKRVSLIDVDVSKAQPTTVSESRGPPLTRVVSPSSQVLPSEQEAPPRVVSPEPHKPKTTATPVTLSTTATSSSKSLATAAKSSRRSIQNLKIAGKVSHLKHVFNRQEEEVAESAGKPPSTTTSPRTREMEGRLSPDIVPKVSESAEMAVSDAGLTMADRPIRSPDITPKETSFPISVALPQPVEAEEILEERATVKSEVEVRVEANVEKSPVKEEEAKATVGSISRPCPELPQTGSPEVKTLPPRPPSPIGYILEDSSDGESSYQSYDTEYSDEDEDEEEEEEGEEDEEEEEEGEVEDVDSGTISRRTAKTLQAVTQALMSQELSYLQSLEILAETYLPSLTKTHVPSFLQGRGLKIFANVADLYEVHRTFYAEVSSGKLDTPPAIVESFCQALVRNQDSWNRYQTFLLNMEQGQRILSQYGGTFFQEVQASIGDHHTLEEHFVRPRDQLMRYDRILKDVVMCAQKEYLHGVGIAKDALRVIQNILHATNNAMAMAKLRGCPISLDKTSLLMAEEFNMYTTEKKKVVREMVVFLDRQYIVFAADLMGGKEYDYWEHIETTDLHLMETYKAKEDRFALSPGPPTSAHYLYVLQPLSPDTSIKTAWVDILHSLLRQGARDSLPLHEAILPRPYHFRKTDLYQEGDGEGQRTLKRQGSLKRSLSLKKKSSVRETGKEAPVKRSDSFGNKKELVIKRNKRAVNEPLPPEIMLTRKPDPGSSTATEDSYLYVVTEDFVSQTEGFLTVRKGQLVEVLDQGGGGGNWLVVALASAPGDLEDEGFLPARCLQPASKMGVSRPSPMDTASSHYGDKTTPHSSHDQLMYRSDRGSHDTRSSAATSFSKRSGHSQQFISQLVEDVYYSCEDTPQSAANKGLLSLAYGQSVEVLDASGGDLWLVKTTDTASGKTSEGLVQRSWLTPKPPPPRNNVTPVQNGTEPHPSHQNGDTGLQPGRDTDMVQLRGHPPPTSSAPAAVLPGTLFGVYEPPKSMIFGKPEVNEGDIPVVEDSIKKSTPTTKQAPPTILEQAPTPLKSEEEVKAATAADDELKRLQVASVNSQVQLDNFDPVEMYVAIADFEAAEDSNISLRAGEHVQLMDSSRSDWWLVSLPESGQSGWVPADYLEKMTLELEGRVTSPRPEPFHDETGEIERVLKRGHRLSQIQLSRHRLYQSPFLATAPNTVPKEPTPAQLEGVFSISVPYVAMTEILAQHANQLSLVKDQPVRVLDCHRDDWWLVQTIPDNLDNRTQSGGGPGQNGTQPAGPNGMEPAGQNEIFSAEGWVPATLLQPSHTDFTSEGGPKSAPPFAAGHNQPLWVVLADYPGEEEGTVRVWQGDLVEVIDISRNEWCLIRPVLRSEETAREEEEEGVGEWEEEGWVPAGFLKPYSGGGFAYPFPRFAPHVSTDDESDEERESLSGDETERLPLTPEPNLTPYPDPERRAEATKKRSFIVSELVSSEKDYVARLEFCVQNYITPAQGATAPKPLQTAELFDYLVKIFEFHRDSFLPHLEACQSQPEDLGGVFASSEESLQVYVAYCKAKAASHALLQEHRGFFEELRALVQDRLELADYLILPVSRITKCSLLLSDFRKQSARSAQSAGQVDGALEVTRGISRQANNAIHLDMLEGLSKMEVGELVLLDTFKIQAGAKPGSKQRQVFLFPECLLVAKRERGRSYSVKDKLMLQDISMAPDMDPQKKNLIIYDMNSGTKFTLTAAKSSMREQWLSKTQKLIQSAKADTSRSAADNKTRAASEPPELAPHSPTLAKKVTALKNSLVSKKPSFRLGSAKRPDSTSAPSAVPPPTSTSTVAETSDEPVEGTEYVVMECIVLEGGDDVQLEPGEVVTLVRVEGGGASLRVRTTDAHLTEGTLPATFLRKKTTINGVDMEAAPKFTMLPSDLDLLYGTTATIACAFNGFPKPSVEWRMNRQTLTSADNRVKITSCATSSILEIIKLCYEDVGTYACFITNSGGSNSAHMVLNLHGPPAKVGKPGVSKVTGTSVKLKWTPPEEEGGSPITTYQVEMLQEGFEDWQPIIQQPKTTFVVKALQPSTSYQFRVLACNQYGAGQPSDPSDTVTTKGRGWLNSSPSNTRKKEGTDYADGGQGLFDDLAGEEGSGSNIMSPPAQFIRRGSIHSEYDVLPEELGRGRFGIIHKCIHRQTGLQIVAKYVRLRSRKKAEIRREVEICRKVTGRSPYLMEFHDAFERGKNLVIVTELVPGGELIERVLEDNDLTEGVVVRYLSHLLAALDTLHTMNIAHLDIKPENLLISGVEENPIIKLIDFGSAQELNGDVAMIAISSPEFSAPEVICQEGPQLVSDMWSVGVLTYVLLGGTSPFFSENAVMVVDRIKEARYDFYGEQFEQISMEAKEFISALLQKNPEYRMSASQALQHDWITTLLRVSVQESVSPWPMARIDTSRLKSFNARRKWHTTAVATDATAVFGPRSAVFSPIPPDFEELLGKQELPPSLYPDSDVDVNAAQGSTVSFQFQVSGQPEPNVVWERGSQRLATGDRVVITTNEGVTTLTIHEVTREDKGLYVCCAMNHLGNTVQECQITLLEPPPPPTDVNGVILGSYNSALVSWLSCGDGPCPITRYLLQLRRTDSSTKSWTQVADDITSTAHVVENLERGVAYVFRVCAMNEVGCGMFSQPSPPLTITDEPDYDSDGPEMEDVRRIIQPLALDSYLSSLNSSSHQ